MAKRSGTPSADRFRSLSLFDPPSLRGPGPASIGSLHLRGDEEKGCNALRSSAARAGSTHPSHRSSVQLQEQRHNTGTLAYNRWKLHRGLRTLTTRVKPSSLKGGEEAGPELRSQFAPASDPDLEPEPGSGFAIDYSPSQRDELDLPATTSQDLVLQGTNAASFRRRLMNWYRQHARVLPWRDTSDPYRIWVSEIMLQQTRVAAVIEHYTEFLRRFPTIIALALASEPDVLAAWSGLGYYRRARMLHKAARFIVLERSGALPASSAELRTLPGIGDYTAAAIASIAYGESTAVVDGNVERVILRLAGRPEENSAATRAFVRTQAQALMPARRVVEAPTPAVLDRRPSASSWTTAERLAIAAAAHPDQPAGEPPHSDVSPGDLPPGQPELTGEVLPGRSPRANAAGDHNQAIMELGATICLPRAPLCLHCPVYALCRTRGEHPTPPRAPQLSRPVAYLLQTRKSGGHTEVLLERRDPGASLMPGMFELPPLPLDAVEGREPILRLRHAITGTNYYVQIYTGAAHGSASARRIDASQLRKAIPAGKSDLHWLPTSRLRMIPLTGLARKVLHRLKFLEGPRIELLK